MSAYQDAWASGQVVSTGYRECSDRYEVVRTFCESFQGKFTVCDIGANMCYFGLRLTDDFPGCSVMAFEFDHFEMRSKHVKNSDKTGRLLLLNRKLKASDLLSLASIHRFDLVLAMSVLHHLPGDHAEWMQSLRALGRNVIAEFAGEDNVSRVRLRKGYRVPDNAVLLGYGSSHLAEFQRPIVHIKGNEQ